VCVCVCVCVKFKGFCRKDTCLKLAEIYLLLSPPYPAMTVRMEFVCGPRGLPVSVCLVLVLCL